MTIDLRAFIKSFSPKPDQREWRTFSQRRRGKQTRMTQGQIRTSRSNSDMIVNPCMQRQSTAAVHEAEITPRESAIIKACLASRQAGVAPGPL